MPYSRVKYRHDSTIFIITVYLMGIDLCQCILFSHQMLGSGITIIIFNSKFYSTFCSQTNMV